MNLQALLAKAVELYNRYRAPEAVAEVLKVRDEVVEVFFTGSFTSTCGVVDWVEDFKYVLEDLGAEAELVEVREHPEGRIGVFRVRGKTRSKVSSESWSGGWSCHRAARARS